MVEWLLVVCSCGIGVGGGGGGLWWFANVVVLLGGDCDGDDNGEVAQHLYFSWGWDGVVCNRLFECL